MYIAIPLVPAIIFFIVLIISGVSYTATKVLRFVLFGWIVASIASITLLVQSIVAICKDEYTEKKWPIASRVYSIILVLISIGLIVFVTSCWSKDIIAAAALGNKSFSGLFHWATSFIGVGIEWLIFLAICYAAGYIQLVTSKEMSLENKAGKGAVISTFCILVAIILVVLNYVAFP